MDTTAESLAKFLPYYLTDERKQGLIAALRNPPSRQYFSTLGSAEPLQGDGWRGLPVFRFETGARERVFGILLSNSCDLSSENPRLMPLKLCFAPLIRFETYLGLLRKNGVAETRLEQHARDIRAQFITNVFYLPAEPAVGAEYMAFLDDLHSMPVPAFKAEVSARTFSLSNVGFYLFVLKLSVHFCRLHENLDRNSA